MVVRRTYNIANWRRFLEQGVVTYMSRVEVFATGKKSESNNQSPFGKGGGGNQGIKVTSGLLKINNQEPVRAIWPFDPSKSSNQHPQKGTIKQSSRLFAHQKIDRGRKCFNRWHMWLPLAECSCNGMFCQYCWQMILFHSHTWQPLSMYPVLFHGYVLHTYDCTPSFSTSIIS